MRQFDTKRMLLAMALFGCSFALVSLVLSNSHHFSTGALFPIPMFFCAAIGSLFGRAALGALVGLLLFCAAGWFVQSL